MRKVVVPLHGIRTHAKWQRAFAEVAQQHDFYCPLEKWDFGKLSLLRFLLPWQRQAKIRWFRSTYNDLMEDRHASLGDNNYPSAVAHSFGAYILGYALLKYRNIKFDKVVLCGSILPRSFPWKDIIERGQVSEVRNEYGVKDIWVKLVKWFVKGAGSSGQNGFRNEDDRVIQEEFVFQHSEYFDRGHMGQLWIPFLLRPSIRLPEKAKPIPLPTTPTPFGLYSIYVLIIASFLASSYFFERHWAQTGGPLAWITGPEIQLRAIDTSIWLMVNARNVQFPYNPPQRIRIFASVGPFYFESVMDLQIPPAREYPGSRDPNLHWIYLDKQPSLTYKNSVRSFSELIGKRLTVYIPVKAFSFVERASSWFNLKIQLQNQVLEFETNKGQVQETITSEMLK